MHRILTAQRPVSKPTTGGGMMDRYPALALTYAPRLPDFLTQEDVGFILVPTPAISNKVSILSTLSDSVFGRQSFMPEPSDGPLGPAPLD